MGRKRDGKRITQTVIANAKPKAGDYTIWDVDLAGFGLRIRPTGTKRFVYYYRNALGVQRRMTIGDAETLKLEDVRSTVKTLAGKVANHMDPSEHLHIETVVIQPPKFHRQQGIIPVGPVGRGVVGDAVGLHHFGREVIRHVHRNLF